MTIQEALDAWLKANVTITALVPAARIYQDNIPQDQTSVPCLVHRFLSGDESPYLSGEPNDLHRDLFELTAVGPVRKNLMQVRDAILAEMGGTVARSLWQPGIYVSGCIPQQTSGMTNQPNDASERRDREETVNLIIIWGRR